MKQFQDYINYLKRLHSNYEEGTGQHNVIGIAINEAEECLNNFKKESHSLSLVKELFSKLTDEERIEVISGYCKYCGCNDSGCQCWNDD